MVTAEVAALAVTVDVEQVAVVATRATALQMVASVLFLTVVITLVVATADLVVVDLKTHLQLVVAEATLVEAEEAGALAEIIAGHLAAVVVPTTQVHLNLTQADLTTAMALSLSRDFKQKEKIDAN